MLDALAPGDVVTVTRIDRLARSTFALFGIVKLLIAATARALALSVATRDTAGFADRECFQTAPASTKLRSARDMDAGDRGSAQAQQAISSRSHRAVKLDYTASVNLNVLVCDGCDRTTRCQAKC